MSLFCQTGHHSIKTGTHHARRPAKQVRREWPHRDVGRASWVYDKSEPPEIYVWVCAEHPLNEDPYEWVDTKPVVTEVTLSIEAARALKAVLDAMRSTGGKGWLAEDLAADLHTPRTQLRRAMAEAGWDTEPRLIEESPTQQLRLALMDVVGMWGHKRFLSTTKRLVVNKARKALLSAR